MSADRLTDLETHVAHLARTVEELSDVIATQDREIERLKRAMRGLMEREADRAASAHGAPPADQRPPHW